MGTVKAGVLPSMPEPARARGSWQWVRHEKSGSRAALRRQRQMANGVLPRVCTSCETHRVPPDRALPICDACLEAKWKIDRQPKGDQHGPSDVRLE